MKHIHLFILIVFLSNKLLSQPSDYKAYFPFDGHPNDVAGGVSGYLNGAELTTDRFGNENSAYSFDGGSNYIEVSPFVDEEFSRGSISVWFKANSIQSNNSRIVEFGSISSRIGVFIDSGICTGYALNEGRTELEINSNSILNDEVWHHLVLTWETDASYLYIDGMKQTEIDNNFTLALNNGDILRIGSYVGGDYNFTGSIDEVMIFNRVLLNCEIESLYNNTNICNNTNGLWVQNTENIFHQGKVAIGRNNIPNGFHLAIDGKVITEEVKVTLSEWSDFVFEPFYKLMPIKDLEDFISTNNHLPEIPSEKEVKENGVNLGQMDAKLLQKIEELTLYIIHQNKRIEILEKKMKNN